MTYMQCNMADVKGPFHTPNHTSKWKY
jgi:hypothetical protein